MPMQFCGTLQFDKAIAVAVVLLQIFLLAPKQKKWEKLQIIKRVNQHGMIVAKKVIKKIIVQ